VAVARGEIPAQALFQPDLTVEFVEEQAGLEKITAEHRAGGGDPAKRQRRKGARRRIEGAPLGLIGVLERGISERADGGQHIRLRHRRIEGNNRSRRAVKLLRQQMERRSKALSSTTLS
jgi:hypothetical protein